MTASDNAKPARGQPLSSRRHTRTIDQRVRELIERDGDHCTLCRARFQHNCKTYYGTTYSGTVACVGECCAKRLQRIHASGVYCSAEHAHEFPLSAEGEQPKTPAEIAAAIEKLQDYIAAADQVCVDIGKRAGVPKDAPVALHTADSVWKDADRLWFEKHPERSHRLRRVIFGEPYYRGKQAPILPPGHEMQILVRQVKPGMRLRISFARNLKVDIPDCEPILHALFDVVSGNPDRETPISAKEIGVLAEQYAQRRESLN